MPKEKSKIITVDGHDIYITNYTFPFFPHIKLRKFDLASYYARIGEHMITLIKDHPLTLHRFPHGVEGEGFYQKDVTSTVPDFIKQVSIPKSEGGIVHYIVAHNTATLVYLAQLGCITPHAWLSTASKPHHPDRMIFDLDPAGTATFKEVCKTARLLHKELKRRNLDPFLMTTGSRGLHVTISLEQRYTNDQVKAYAREVAEVLVKKNPSLCTLEMHIQQRGNLIFIDTLRNAYAQTAVAPYALRALPKAPIATPITWQELGSIKTPQAFTVKNIFRRLSRIQDPWSFFFEKKHSL